MEEIISQVMTPCKMKSLPPLHLPFAPPFPPPKWHGGPNPSAPQPCCAPQMRGAPLSNFPTRLLILPPRALCLVLGACFFSFSLHSSERPFFSVIEIPILCFCSFDRYLFPTPTPPRPLVTRSLTYFFATSPSASSLLPPETKSYNSFNPKFPLFVRKPLTLASSPGVFPSNPLLPTPVPSYPTFSASLNHERLYKPPIPYRSPWSPLTAFPLLSPPRSPCPDLQIHKGLLLVGFGTHRHNTIAFFPFSFRPSIFFATPS